MVVNYISHSDSITVNYLNTKLLTGTFSDECPMVGK